MLLKKYERQAAQMMGKVVALLASDGFIVKTVQYLPKGHKNLYGSEARAEIVFTGRDGGRVFEIRIDADKYSPMGQLRLSTMGDTFVGENFSFGSMSVRATGKTVSSDYSKTGRSFYYKTLTDREIIVAVRRFIAAAEALAA